MSLFQSAFSQSWQRISDRGNELTDIHWVNEDVAFASGDQIMLKTTDGGDSWTEISMPMEASLLSVDFYDHENGAMSGENGVLLQTKDGGQSWKAVELSSTEDLLTVKYLTKDNIWIAGTSGTLQYSSNGGDSWTSVEPGITADISTLFFPSNDRGYLGTSSGAIYKTSDGGQTWQPLASSINTPINDLCFTNDTTGYAVGDEGVILKTIDAGDNWAFIQSGTNYDYKRVAFNRDSPDTGIIVGEAGTVLFTNNAGLTFAIRNSRTVEDINNIAYKQSTNTVFAVADAGTILRSTNSGSSWTSLFTGNPKDFLATDFVSDSRGYIAGKEAVILRTTNSGNSFADYSRPLTTDFHDIAFVSSAFGYVVGNDGTILNTTNSGGSWTALNPNTEKDLFGLYFSDADTGYIVGEDGYLAKTENRGINWTTINAGDKSFDFYDVDFFQDGSGIIVGEGGRVFRNSGAEDWQEVYLGITSNLNGIFVISETSAVMVGDNGQAFLTEDQGGNWKQLNTHSTQHLRDVAFLDSLTGFIVGDEGMLLQTTDQGETWRQVDTETFQDFRAISFGDVNTGYAVGEYGMIYQYSCEVPTFTGTITGQDNICLSQQIYTLENEGSEGLTYEWRVDGGSIIEGQGSDRIVVQWESPGRNGVLVKSQNVCGDGPTTALEVTVSTTPEKIMEITGNGVACLKRVSNYEVDSIPGMEYIWTANNGIIQSGQGTAHVAIEWESEGQQQLSVFPKNACGETSATNKAITVTRAPAQPETIMGLAQVGLEEQLYEVTAVDGINYQWSTEGGSIISGQGTHSALVNWEREGDFLLEVTPSNSCNEGASQQLNVNVNLITGIEKEAENAQVKIYPNPSSGNIHIEVKGAGSVREIRVVDPLGKYLRKITPHHDIFDFYIENLPAGLWLIEVETAAGKTVDKVWIK
ncbi:YCF48-related protein [Echinicola soli]|nr:YCF48-related protein [Echinicola soli]